MNNGQFRISDPFMRQYFEQFDDGLYQLVRIEDLNNNYQQFKRNQQGWLEKITHSNGYQIHFKNSDKGLREEVDWFIDDENKGHIASLRYDDRGHLLSLESPVGSSFEWTYNNQNLLQSWKDSLHTQVTINYDEHNRVISTETSGAYHGDRFEYNDADRVTSYYPGGTEEVTHFYYDENENVVAKENAQGETNYFEYNTLNQKTADIDAKGRRTEYEYNFQGNIVLITKPDGSKTEYDYNIQGWLRRVTNSLNQSWNYTYDKQGNVTTIIDPAGGMEKYEYDVKGNLVATIDIRGSRVEREYDSHNRLIKITDSMGNITYIERDMLETVFEATKFTPPFNIHVVEVPQHVIDTIKELQGTLEATLYDDKWNVIARVPVKDLYDVVAKLEPGKVYAIVYDGIITQRMLDLAYDKQVKLLIANKIGNIERRPPGIQMLTFNDIL
ncbi:MAG TPA: hypothetical protein EYP08_01910 [Pyrodictiaceae archaeon]|nr:hypothetical protein [Pyrodictiaceae archaeon]